MYVQICHRVVYDLFYCGASMVIGIVLSFCVQCNVQPKMVYFTLNLELDLMLTFFKSTEKDLWWIVIFVSFIFSFLFKDSSLS